MEIDILGPYVLCQGNKRWTLASQRVSTVLTLLALNPGSPVPFDQFTDELWGDRRMANERNALQANITRLRKLLVSVTGRKGSEIIRTVSSGYLLDLPAEAVDVHRFATLADRGAALVPDDPAAAARNLEEALGLWRGPALMDADQGFRCRLEATNLEERRLTAYEDLVTARLAAGEDRVPVPELRQLAAEHPGRERLSELLMLTLYRDGRQTEALEVFHGTRRRLDAELGLEPGRSLHRVYQAILTQDASLGEPRQCLVAQ